MASTGTREQEHLNANAPWYTPKHLRAVTASLLLVYLGFVAMWVRRSPGPIQAGPLGRAVPKGSRPLMRWSANSNGSQQADQTLYEPSRGHQKHAKPPVTRREHDDSVSALAPSTAIFTKLLERHRRMQDNVLSGRAPLKRALIVRCKRSDACAGLGDRVYGFLELYLAAILTDRVFFIVNEKPRPMDNFVIPNKLDWRITSIQDTEVRQKVTQCVDGRGGVFDSCDYRRITLPFGQCSHFIGEVFTPRDVVVAFSNQRTECVQKLLVRKGILPPKGAHGFTGSNMDLQHWAANVSHIMFRALFKFKDCIIRLAQRTLLLPNSSSKSTVTPECLVCLHVRSGSGVSEKPRHTNWKDFATCGKQAQADLEKESSCPGKPSWLIVSDNSNAPSYIKREIDESSIGGVFTTSQLGTPTHIDKNNGASQDMVAHVFVDWYLLTQCKFFVASLSTFSGTASIAGGPHVRRYDMETNGRVGGCQRHSIADWQRDANA